MTEPIEIYEMSPGESVVVYLPHNIGHVEIRTDGVNPGTGNPTVGVDVVSRTKRIPAGDGRLYRPQFDHDCGVVLIGRPGSGLIEDQRLADVMKAHESGDHSDCPDTCPGR